MKKLSQQEFLNKCYEVHGSKYNYLETKYYNMRTKIKIICCEQGIRLLHVREDLWKEKKKNNRKRTNKIFKLVVKCM